MKSRLGNRYAFTLIETMIAMSLMSMLMAIVWTMFSIYTKIEAKGVTRAEEAGLVRAISRQIRHDLLHVVGVDQKRGVSIDAKSDPTANRFPANGYLVGTSTDLHFLVCIEAGSTEVTDVIRMISYQPHTAFTQEADQLDETDAAIDVTEPLASAFADEHETPLGIDRHQRSWIDYWEDRTLDDSPADLLSTNRPMVLDADDLIQIGTQAPQEDSQDQQSIAQPNVTDEIPELARFRLRYFDGDSWSGQWDSTANGRLPLAIEIEFDLEVVKRTETDTDPDSRASDEVTSENQVRADAGTINIGDQEGPENVTLYQYRFMVSIPAASISRDRAEPESLP